MKVDAVWEKFVTDLEDIDFGIGTFNFELDRALSNRVGVTSPPSIVMIINKKVKFFNDEYTQKNMREFVRNNLPNNLIRILNDDTVAEFLQDYSANKIRVIFSSSKPRPSLRFLSTAFKYQKRFDFGFISNSDKKSKSFKDLYKLYPGKETLLLFHEYYDSAFASINEQKLQGKNIENILNSNKYLILPRLSSPNVFNELCPTGTTRRSKAVCVVLFTYNIKDHEEYRKSFRNYVKEQSSQQRVKYAYVYADSQTQFAEAITRKEGIENVTTKALKVALIWRNSKLDLYYSLLEDGWKLGEYNEESVSALKKLVDTAVNTRDTLDFKIDQPSIIDEHQAPLLSRILNKLDDWYDLGMMKIRSMDSATWLAIFVSIFVVLGIGFMSSALSKLDKPVTQSKNKERSNQNLPKEKPTVYLQTFCAQTYDKYVLRGERGLRTLIIMTDNEYQNKLLQKFASIVLPYTNGDAFIFCALDLDEYLGWYRHLLEETLDFRRDLSTINKKNCVGTVLALNGSRNYYSIFHPKLPSNDFLGLDDSSDGENQTDSTININDVLNGLGSWMDRLCEGQIKRFRVQYWPMLSR
ncbi:DgyrCDS4253 [Dimorphilus gyrociliatus]|uniref:DgyrCDS4253 n=1 Tax=Dimorphilus gyrociliatus TaxID=2664684 RepID=A0A7I8VGY6_9ANNE|nr:DgyrCDS4253 [Dimorphilus gyrociliatus]